MARNLIQPSFHQGFAKSRGESAHPELWDGLVGAWIPALGVQGGQLLDVGGHENHGTLTNMDPATDWVVGRSGYTLDFDGVNDKVVVADSQSLRKATTAITIIAFFYMKSGGQDFGQIIDKVYATSDPWVSFNIGDKGSPVGHDDLHFALSTGVAGSFTSSGAIDGIPLNTLVAAVGRWGGHLGQTMKFQIYDLSNGISKFGENTNTFAGPIGYSSSSLYFGEDEAMDNAAYKLSGCYVSSKSWADSAVMKLLKDPLSPLRLAETPIPFVVAGGPAADVRRHLIQAYMRAA